MMPAFIDHGSRVYFVPILRQRLNFAVLFRRAIRELGPWTSRDLVAVSLPPSVLPLVRRAVSNNDADPAWAGPPAMLPISLVIARWGESDYREVFPISPCDGIIEAVRFCVEMGYPLEAVDREISPGNLVPRRCLDDPEWPDDELVLRWGPTRYSDMIADRLEQPPTRFEPIDTWREMCMADRIRAVQLRYHRVIVVCEFVHVAGVRRLLRAPSRRLDRDAESKPRDSARLSVFRARPEVALGYLDDFPRLAEFYEQARADGKAAEFDRMGSLFRAIQGARHKSTPWGTRRLQTFHRFLLQILEQQRRVAPRPREVQQACRVCFGSSFASSVLHHLGGYGNEIRLERVGDLVAEEPPEYTVRTPDPGPNGWFVSRSCNPTRTQFLLRPRPPVPQYEEGHEYSGWVPHSDEFMRRMRQRAVSCALLQSRRRRSEAFRGSLEQGIDARRTLRSALSGSPSIFVRVENRIPVTQKISGEPVVWVLRPVIGRQSPFGGYRLECVVEGQDGKKYEGTEETASYPQSSGYYAPPKELFKADDGSFAIECVERLGFLTLWDGSLEQARQLLGKDFDEYIPEHRSGMRIHPSVGCVMKELFPLADRGVPWWDLLMLMAIRCARESAVFVVPDGFRLSGRVVEEARVKRKRLLCARVSHFSDVERSRLGHGYRIRLPAALKDDDKFWERIREVLWTRLAIVH